MLTQEVLRLRFDYHEDGWLIRRSTGRVCGTIKERYTRMVIDQTEYYMHHLVWLWHNGYWPGQIDHINGDGFNNRIENLRECTATQNAGNANWGSMRGVEKHGRKYRVRICTNYGKIELGSYETLEGAVEARDKGYQEYFGEFYND